MHKATQLLAIARTHKCTRICTYVYTQNICTNRVVNTHSHTNATAIAIAYMRTRIHMDTRASTHKSAHSHTNTYTHTHTHTHTHTRPLGWHHRCITWTHEHLHTRAHTRTHTYTHTHPHTTTWVASQVHHMAIGRGQGAAADKLIRNSVRDPCWVVLENTHLAGDYMPQLCSLVQV